MSLTADKPASDADAQRRAQEARAALLARIDNDFTYHAPKPGQAERYALIRDTAKRLARVMVENCPPSRELSTALTNLETAVFNANAAIARNE